MKKELLNDPGTYGHQCPLNFGNPTQRALKMAQE